MSNCQATTKKGEECSAKAKFGDYCGRHRQDKGKKNEDMQDDFYTITNTFCDCGENSVGMQKIGKLAKNGFSTKFLKKISQDFEDNGYETEIIDLGKVLNDYDSKSDENATVLVIRNGLTRLLEDDIVENYEKEQKDLKKDTKAFMRGKVKNKIARHNLCFADFHQEPDYENKKGTIYSWEEVPILSKVKDNLEKILEEYGDSNTLLAEANYYYSKSSGIGFHGDSERKKVIAIRVGSSMPLVFQWYQHSNPVGELTRIDLNSGDMYFMSEKAVGFDWLKTKDDYYTLRHAAGAKKYITPKVKKVKDKSKEDSDEE